MQSGRLGSRAIVFPASNGSTPLQSNVGFWEPQGQANGLDGSTADRLLRVDYGLAALGRAVMHNRTQ
jgi:hypothetical protein